jgi:hypothetical protein
MRLHCTIQTSFLYAFAYPKNASHSFGGYMFRPLYNTSPWRLTRGAFHKAAPFVSCNYRVFKSMKDKQKIYGCRLYWLVSQVAGNSNFLEAE